MDEEPKLDEMFCCFGLQNVVKEAGNRGFAVLALKMRNGITFLLQSRGIAHADQGRVAPGFPVTINISSETGLRFCPWCGTRLQDLVEASPACFEQLAEKHITLIPEQF
jgi:hypothetical protein